MARIKTKIEVQLDSEQIQKLDAIRKNWGLNTRSGTVRMLIQGEFLRITERLRS